MNSPTAASSKNTTCDLIGANVAAIKKAEDRLFFKDAMQKIGLDVPKSALVNNTKDGLEFAGKIGFPGHHSSLVHSGRHRRRHRLQPRRTRRSAGRGLDLSPVHEALIEESVLGWKEFELEVMRDTSGQRHHHLLDRELRSHGRAHR